LDNKRIIIYEGIGRDAITIPSIVVLEIERYEWYQPTILGSIPTINRFDHTVTVVGIYMIVLFGRNIMKDGPDYRLNGESDLLLLNIKDNENFIWTTSFEPLKNIPFLVGVTVGPVIGCII